MDDTNTGIPSITWEEYHNLAGVTATYPESGSGSQLALLYVACGLAGEAGEVANKLKKVARDDGGQITPERRGAVAKEMGDVMWYISRVCTELNLDLGEIMMANLTMLAARAQLNMIHGDGDNREQQHGPYPYGRIMGVEYNTAQFVVNAEGRAVYCTLITVTGTEGVVTLALDWATSEVVRVAVDGRQLEDDELEAVMPWLRPLIHGEQEAAAAAAERAKAAARLVTPDPLPQPDPGSVVVTSTPSMTRAEFYARYLQERGVDPQWVHQGSLYKEPEDKDVCAACGRTYSPWHKADEPGGTVRHPFKITLAPEEMKFYSDFGNAMHAAIEEGIVTPGPVDLEPERKFYQGWVTDVEKADLKARVARQEMEAGEFPAGPES